jgi:hypothetical protein
MNGATMEAMRIRKTVESDGEVHLTGLPCHRGEKVEMILIIGTVERSSKRQLTARDLRQSGLVGLWSHRRDIGNSSTFARRLRQTAQKRVS